MWNCLKVVLGAAVLTFCGAGANAADAYQVDGVHSAVVFKVNHMNAGNVWGRFNKISGTVQFDAEKPEACSISVDVEATSVDTGNEKRDEHLRSPDFFNVKEFAKLSFVSKSIKKSGDDYEVSGTFTLHGVSKEITFTAKKTGLAKGMKEEMRLGLEAVFSIKRAEYGMNYMPDKLGAEIPIVISLECVKQ